LEIADTVGADPRFTTNRERNAHRAELIETLSKVFAAEPTEAWLPRLQSAGIPCGPISSVSEAFANEQLRARGGVVEQAHPLAGAIRSIGNPVHLSDSPPAYQKPPPTLGQHTGEILQELGYDSETVDALRAQRVV
jgi:crotonobetainyl-CoA:carnitine CoA-transferase CaiB-like acyl-CoA transferase